MKAKQAALNLFPEQERPWKLVVSNRYVDRIYKMQPEMFETEPEAKRAGRQYLRESLRAVCVEIKHIGAGAC